MSSSARHTSSGALLGFLLGILGASAGCKRPPPSPPAAAPSPAPYREAFEKLGGRADPGAAGCIACHLGMFDLGFALARGGSGATFADPARRSKAAELFGAPDRDRIVRALMAHPRPDLLAGPLSPHAAIDCRTCHVTTDRSDDPALDERRLAEWRRFHMTYHPVLKDVPLRIPRSTEAVCLKCHRGEDPLPGAETLRRGRQLYQETHCHACHVTPGLKTRAEDLTPGEARVRLPGPPLTSIADKVDKAWANAWLYHPTEFKPSARMPPFFPRGPIGFPPQLIDKVPRGRETLFELVLTACATEYLFSLSRSQPLEEIPEGLLENEDWKVADQQERGRKLTVELGCLACHRIEEDYDINYRVDGGFREDEFATNLFGSGDKFDSARGRRWLFHWIKDPRRLHPDTPMPSFGLSDAAVADIVQFLLSLKIDNDFRLRRGLLRWEPRPVPIELVAEEARADPGAVEALDALVRHARGPMDGSLRDKVLWEGKRVVEVFACYACHEMGGAWDGAPIVEGPFHKDLLPGKGVMERMPLIGTSADETRAISTYLWAHYETLDPPPVERAGNPQLEGHARGERILQKYNCQGCHVLDEERLYLRAGGRIVAAPVEAKDRVEAVESRPGPHRAVQWLREAGTLRLPGVLELFGNHVPEDSIDRLTPARGGLWTRRRLRFAGEEDKAELPYRKPPSLRTVGRKLQPEWLAAYLRHPTRIRPGAAPIMPEFRMEAGEVEALVEYFRVRDRAATEDGRGRLGREEIESRFDRFREIDRTMRRACSQCHTVDGKGAERSVDLALVHRRIQAPWLEAFLEDPASIYPGTAMPEWPKDFPLRDFVDLLMNYDRFRETKVARGEPSEAIEALGTVDTDRVALIGLALERSLQDRTFADAALHALELVDAGMPDVLPAVRGHLTHDATNVRRAALNALWALGARESGAAVAGRAADPDPTIRVRALEVLGGLALREQASAAARALSDDHSFVRLAAVAALERMGAVDRAPEIAERLHDPETQVRARAAEALGRLPAAGQGVPLVSALVDDSPSVRYAALMALAWRSEGASEAEPLLADSDEAVRAAACVCLVRGGVARGADALREMLDAGITDRAARKALSIGLTLLLPAETLRRKIEPGRRTVMEWIREVGASTDLSPEEEEGLGATVAFPGGSFADLAMRIADATGLAFVDRDGGLHVRSGE
jgi:mono/diheme cytochrome c family protein/cytochrome c2